MSPYIAFVDQGQGSWLVYAAQDAVGTIDDMSIIRFLKGVEVPANRGKTFQVRLDCLARDRVFLATSTAAYRVLRDAVLPA